MIVIDSVGWLAYFKGDALANDYRPFIHRRDEIVCPAVVIYEVAKKQELDYDRRTASRAVAQLERTIVIAFDTALATLAARVSITHKLSVCDAIIYATALDNQADLITSDAHFRNLPHVHFLPHPAHLN